jgi:hypothetical protein
MLCHPHFAKCPYAHSLTLALDVAKQIRNVMSETKLPLK